MSCLSLPAQPHGVSSSRSSASGSKPSSPQRHGHKTPSPAHRLASLVPAGSVNGSGRNSPRVDSGLSVGALRRASASPLRTVAPEVSLCSSPSTITTPPQPAVVVVPPLEPDTPELGDAGDSADGSDLRGHSSRLQLAVRSRLRLSPAGSSAEMVPIIASSDPAIGADPVIRRAGTCSSVLAPGARGASLHDRNLLVHDSRVLVINTGGEMSMRRVEGGGWRGGRNNLRQLIQSRTTLHDSAAPAPAEAAADFTCPITTGQHGGTGPPDRRIRYDLKEYDPLVDSASFDFADWVRIASDIKENYDSYDGFIVIHGTDTLAYTAAGLSFMLEQLGKTVILTGCQIPLCEPRSDGLSNLVDSLLIAGSYVIPEVCVYFARELFRGNRVKKSDTGEFECFRSPNAPLLGTYGTSLQIAWKNIRLPHSESPLVLHSRLCSDISVLHMFPGVTAATVGAALAHPVRGVVLRLYGNGNAPMVRHDILGVLRAAVRDRDVVILSTTQAAVGTVVAESECGRALSRVGVVGGADMTIECAVAKLAFLLGTCDSAADVRLQLSLSIRGELTKPVADRLSGSGEILSRLSQSMGLNEGGEVDELRNYINSVVICSAAQSGDVGALRQLVDVDPSGWQVDVQDHSSRTPLHIAAAAGHTEAVDFLLSHGARVHLKDSGGRTPLLEAVLRGHDEAAASIQRAGGTLGLDELSLAQYMNQAVYSGNLEQVQLFLRYGGAPCVSDYSRCTPLCLAVQQGRVDIVRELLASPGCDVQQRDWWGWTPLEVAREAQSRSTQPQCYVYDTIADLLLRHGERRASLCDEQPPVELGAEPKETVPGMDEAVAVGDTIDT